MTVSASDVRVTGVPVGTAVTVAEGAEKVYVNGHLLAHGQTAAEKSTDPFVDGSMIETVVQ